MRIRLWRGIDSLDLGFGAAAGGAAPGDDSGFLRKDVPHRFVSRVVEQPLGNDVHFGRRILDQLLLPGTGDDHHLSVQSGGRELEAQVGRSALVQVQVLSRAVEAGHGRGDLVASPLRQELEPALIVGDPVNLESGIQIPEEHVGAHQDPAGRVENRSFHGSPAVLGRERLQSGQDQPDDSNRESSRVAHGALLHKRAVLRFCRRGASR